MKMSGYDLGLSLAKLNRNINEEMKKIPNVKDTFIGIELIGIGNIYTYLRIELGKVGRFALHC